MTGNNAEAALAVFFELIDGTRAIIARRHASPEFNLAKLEEEAGELARTEFHPSSRQDIINEVADVIIAAAAQGSFVQMTPEELADALKRKMARAIRLSPLRSPDDAGQAPAG